MRYSTNSFYSKQSFNQHEHFFTNPLHSNSDTETVAECALDGFLSQICMQEHFYFWSEWDLTSFCLSSPPSAQRAIPRAGVQWIYRNTTIQQSLQGMHWCTFFFVKYHFPL